MDLKPYLVKSSRNLKGSSINNYVRNIKTLHGGEPFEDLNWLTDTAALLERIKDYSQTTQRNMLTSAIVVLKAVDEEEFKATLQVYKERLLLLNGAINKAYSEKKKTSKEKSNWLKLGELKAIQGQFAQRVKNRNIADKTELNAKDMKLLQFFMISSLYTLHRPVRLDYAGMKVVHSRKGLGKDVNYLVVVGPRRKYFVFQNFKNVKRIGPQEITVNKELNRVINLYLKFNPTDDFLLNSRGFAMTSNALSKVMSHVFKKGSRSASLNMIRKAWVTDMVDAEQVEKEKQLAQDMLHSTATQKGVYLKED